MYIEYQFLGLSSCLVANASIRSKELQIPIDLYLDRQRTSRNRTLLVACPWLLNVMVCRVIVGRDPRHDRNFGSALPLEMITLILKRYPSQVTSHYDQVDLHGEHLDCITPSFRIVSSLWLIAIKVITPLTTMELPKERENGLTLIGEVSHRTNRQ